MHNHQNRELAESDPPSQKVSLEDQAFGVIVSYLLFCLVIFALFASAWAQLHDEIELQRYAQAATRAWSVEHPPSERAPPQALPEEVAAPVLVDAVELSGPWLGREREGSAAHHIRLPSGERAIAVQDPKLLGKGAVLVLPRDGFHGFREHFGTAVRTRGWLVLLFVIGAGIALRAILRKMIFGPLRSMRQTLAAHRAFEAAGHRRNAVAMRAGGIHIERLPEAPRITPDLFAASEFSFLAHALDEHLLLRPRLEQAFLRALEAFPQPVLAIASDDTLVHANRAFLEFIKIREDDFKSARGHGAEAFLAEQLKLPAELRNRIHRIAEQRLPRCADVDAEMLAGDERQQVLVSASSLRGLHRRFAIVTFRLAHSAALARVQDFLSEIANQQLVTLNRLEQMLLPRMDPAARAEAEAMLARMSESVDLLFDLRGSVDRKRERQHFEFNLVVFFKSLVERMPASAPVELSIPREVPTFIVGDPSGLRRFLRAACERFFRLNPQSALRIALQVDAERRELGVTLESRDRRAVLRMHAVPRAEREPAAGENKETETGAGADAGFGTLENEIEGDLKHLLFRKRAPAGSPHVFLGIGMPLVLGESHAPLLHLDFDERLSGARILVAHTTAPLDEDARALCSALKTREMRTDAVEDAVPTLKADAWDALVVFATRMPWQNDKALRKLVAASQALGIPSLLLPGSPHRGDSLVAGELGFSAYLSRPCSFDEFESILMVLTAPEQRAQWAQRGLLTRHLLLELLQNAGRALVADFDETDKDAAEALAGNLARIGFRVSRATGVNQLVEQLHNTDFGYVFIPTGMASGVRRRVSLAIRGKGCVCYSNGSPLAEDPEGGNSLGGLKVIEDPKDIADIARALQQAGMQFVSAQLGAQGNAGDEGEGAA